MATLLVGTSHLKEFTILSILAISDFLDKSLNLVEKNSMLYAKFEYCSMGIVTDPADVPTVHFLML